MTKSHNLCLRKEWRVFMEKFGRKVVALRIPILILGLALLVPSFFGYVSTRVNYDILSYLPKDIETMVGHSGRRVRHGGLLHVRGGGNGTQGRAKTEA
jgi:hypothetical protein